VRAPPFPPTSTSAGSLAPRAGSLRRPEQAAAGYGCVPCVVTPQRSRSTANSCRARSSSRERIEGGDLSAASHPRSIHGDCERSGPVADGEHALGGRIARSGRGGHVCGTLACFPTAAPRERARCAPDAASPSTASRRPTRICGGGKSDTARRGACGVRACAKTSCPSAAIFGPSERVRGVDSSVFLFERIRVKRPVHPQRGARAQTPPQHDPWPISPPNSSRRCPALLRAPPAVAAPPLFPRRRLRERATIGPVGEAHRLCRCLPPRRRCLWCRNSSHLSTRRPRPSTPLVSSSCLVRAWRRR
jgi:hypothetical protein